MVYQTTVQGIHAVGSMIFKKAVKDKIIREIPADDTDMPVYPDTVEELEISQTNILRRMNWTNF